MPTLRRWHLDEADGAAAGGDDARASDTEDRSSAVQQRASGTEP
ncbi:MAG: hypothetical protein RJA70_2779 [Pseudomonadota bacterium]|jgi:hypothetical protein